MDILSLLQGLAGVKSPSKQQAPLNVHAKRPVKQRTLPEDHLNMLEKLAAATPTRGNVVDRRFSMMTLPNLPENIRVKNPQMPMIEDPIGKLQGAYNDSYENGREIQRTEGAYGMQGPYSAQDLNQAQAGGILPVRQRGRRINLNVGYGDY